MPDFPDEFSIQRAKRQNAQTAPDIDRARWEDVDRSLNLLIDDWSPNVNGMRTFAYRTFLDVDGPILAALLAIAVERLADSRRRAHHGCCDGSCGA